MRLVSTFQMWSRLCLIWALSVCMVLPVMAQDAGPADVTEPAHAQWVEDAIKMVEFIEENALVLHENAYEEYEKIVLKAPSHDKLDRLYDLLIVAMFVGNQDVTDQFMPLYVDEIEKSESIEHRQSLDVLTLATQGYRNWTYEKAIQALEVTAYDEGAHSLARVRALSIVGFLYGFTKNTDHIVSTLQKMEAIATKLPDDLVIKKDVLNLKGLLAIHTNDPGEMVKYTSELVMLSFNSNALVYGGVVSDNFTYLVMQYGNFAEIDKINEVNQRVARMTGESYYIFRAYMNCVETAVQRSRNEKALQCLDIAENYINNQSQAHIRYYLYSAIAFARDGQAEKARANLEIAKNIPEVQSSVSFTDNIKWATSEVLQAEGEYTEAYTELRAYFENRVSSQKKEIGEVTRSLRIYSEEKTALLQERTEFLAHKENLQDRVISRQRILIILSALTGGILIGFVYLQRQTTEKLRKAREKTIKANRTIRLEARTDQLTRIGNRRAFYEYCTTVYESSEHKTFTLAVLDLDGFKLVNDTYGHEAGDLMIQATSQRLDHALDGKGRVFRLGGDEFSILFLSEDDETLSQFKDCISSALKDPVETRSTRLDLNWSVGAVVLNDIDQDPSNFLNQADYALYEAKEKKGPSFHIFSEADFDRINKESSLEEEVLWNLDNASFTMFGQPIVSSAQGVYSLFGVEALIRAQTRRGEIIGPEAFVQNAVSAGKTSRLTKLTLLKSIEMLNASGLDCPLTFNLSRNQITDEDVFQVVNEVLETTSFPANRLIIELSERTLNEDLFSASGTLNAFKKQGIRIALDDLGAANAGFSNLLAFEFDLIKTDRALLASAMTSARRMHVLSNLIDMSQKLNVLCIVEGLETPEEVSFVESLGGGLLQGYIFGRAEETPKFRQNFNWADAPASETAVAMLGAQKKSA